MVAGEKVVRQFYDKMVLGKLRSTAVQHYEKVRYSKDF